MTTEELVYQLESLTHAARVQAMLELGRRNDAESAALIAALEQGGFFERWMALYTCFGSQDSAHVRRALTDQSRIIRGLAIRLLPLVCDAAQLQSALGDAAPQVRLPLLWKLRQQVHQPIIDRFLEAMAEQHDPQRYAVLPFGSPALVARYIAAFRQQATRGDWRRLAHFHPGATLDLLHQWASEATEFDLQLVGYVNALRSEERRVGKECRSRWS